MNNDLLFFKVWRNIIIRNNIFSILNESVTLVKGYKYKSIISVHWMIKNKHFQLLIDKVTNGEYLVFSSSTFETYKLNGDKLNWIERKKTNLKFDNGRLIGLNVYSLFNKQVSINCCNNNFYYNLFKNYSNHFIGINIYETEYILVEYDNEIGLMVLVEKFNHKLNIDSFFRSFEIGSYECAYYILNKLKCYERDQQAIDKKIWSIILNCSINKNEDINSTIINERIEFITSRCNLPINKSTIKSLLNDTNRSIYLYDFKIYQQSISTLLNCMKSVIQLKELYKLQFDIKSFKLSTKLNQNLSIDQLQLLKQFGQTQLNKEIYQNIEPNLLSSLLLSNCEIPTFEEIELVKSSFSENQLKETKVGFLNLKQHQQYQIILKFYRILLPLTDHFNGCFIDNYIHYKISVDNDYSSLEPYKNHKIIIPKEKFKSKMFGDYNFKELAEFSNSIYDYELFLYCRENKEKQMVFLNTLIEDLKKDDDNLRLPVSQSSFTIIENLITSLIWLDNIEFMELIISNLINTNTNNQKSFSKIKRNLFSKVKSTTMFDLIYSINYNAGMPLNYSILLILINNDRFNILDHYKSNYPLNYYSEVGKVDIRNSNTKFEIFKFIYENLQDFNYENVNFWERNKAIYGYKLDQLIFIIKHTPENKEYSCVGNSEFSDWVFLNRPFDIINLKCLSNPHDLSAYNYFQIKSNLSLTTSNRESLLLNYFKSQDLIYYPDTTNSGLAKVISIEIGKYGNTEFLDFLMNVYKPQVNDIGKHVENDELSSTSSLPPYITNQIRQIDMLFTFILSTICCNGQLDVYKHFETNYPKELNSFLKLNYYSFSLPSLIIRMGHIDFLLYFLSSLKPDKKLKIVIDFQILSYDSNHLINYFKNTNNNYLILKKK